jgi:hypothetical protein
MLSQQIRKIIIFVVFSLFFALISLLRGDIWAAGYSFVVAICSLFVADFIASVIKGLLHWHHIRSRYIALVWYFTFTMVLGMITDRLFLGINMELGYFAGKIVIVAIASLFLFVVYLLSEFFVNLFFGMMFEKTAGHAKIIKEHAKVFGAALAAKPKKAKKAKSSKKRRK